MTDYFISDIHLCESRPELSELFLDFIQCKAPAANSLYILGDLFEVWIGDDDITPFHQSIIEAIKTLSQKIPVYVMRGNRDFLLGHNFAKATKTILLPDPCVARIYFKRTLLMHGDSLCTQDIHHQRFRRFSQNAWIKKLYLVLPLTLRRKIADSIRKKSLNRGQQLTMTMMDVDLQAVFAALAENDSTILIHGHTHRPAIEKHFHNHKCLERFVLSDWHHQGNVLLWHADGKKELVYFTADGKPL